jgi:hypothetical protein
LSRSSRRGDPTTQAKRKRPQGAVEKVTASEYESEAGDTLIKKEQGQLKQSLYVNLSARTSSVKSHAALWEGFQGEYESEDKEFPRRRASTIPPVYV